VRHFQANENRKKNEKNMIISGTLEQQKTERKKKINKMLFIILSVIFASCKTDNFYNTNRTLITDKTEYKIGDEFKLTLQIATQNLKKNIRIYENYKNLEISFSLLNDNENMQNENWSKNIGELLNETKINEIEISKNKPFKRTFTGKITELENKIELNIKELNLSTKFPKTKLKNGIKIRIHGFCNPINPEFGASLEEYFEVVDIKIKKE
jgi:hypothetical protein